MTHVVFSVIYFVAMAAIIILADVLFLRDRFWIRLGVNIGVVVVFAAVYLIFLRDAFPM